MRALGERDAGSLWVAKSFLGAHPFRPVTLRGYDEPARGAAHQNMNGTAVGTVPFHGANEPSSAWRGGGNVTAPCAATPVTCNRRNGISACRQAGMAESTLMW